MRERTVVPGLAAAGWIPVLGGIVDLWVTAGRRDAKTMRSWNRFRELPEQP